jgi:hypothetical protein
LANIQSTGQNISITTIKRERENVAGIGTCPGPSAEQQHEIEPQHIVEQKQRYTANPLDELNNETSTDGFGQIEENELDEEGDERVDGSSIEMDGIRERFFIAVLFIKNVKVNIY